MYHVGNGGMLDSSTVGLLSRPRCGNPDTVMEEPEVYQGLQIPGASRPRRRATQENDGSQSKTISRETDEDETDEVPDQEILNRIADGLRKATEARHPKSDSHLEWEPHPQVMIFAS